MVLKSMAAVAVAALFSANAMATLVYDQNVTSNVIFGSGVTNGSFAVDTANGVELGLRGKLRHDAAGNPQNTFNSAGNGNYLFSTGQAFGQAAGTGIWSFEWSINTNVDGNSGRNLSGLTYKLGVDSNPSAATSFSIFDPINGVNPNLSGFWDHSIGNNATAMGGGAEATDASTYASLIGGNNLAQNSWKPSWFLQNFDPEIDGTYTFFLEAWQPETDTAGSIMLARTEINVIVGRGGNVPEPGTLALAGLALLGITARQLRRKG